MKNNKPIRKEINPVAVLLDIETFEKMEDILEDVVLSRLILEEEDQELLSLNEAKKFYKKLLSNEPKSVVQKKIH